MLRANIELRVLQTSINSFRKFVFHPPSKKNMHSENFREMFWKEAKNLKYVNRHKLPGRPPLLFFGN